MIHNYPTEHEEAASRAAVAEAHQREMDRLQSCHCGRCHCGRSPEGEPVNALGCCKPSHRDAAIKQWQRTVADLEDAIREMSADLATLRQERDEARKENARLRKAATWVLNTAAYPEHCRDGESVEALSALEATLSTPAATPQEPERCVWQVAGYLKDLRAAHGHYFGTDAVEGWDFCPFCGRPLAVATPQEEP